MSVVERQQRPTPNGSTEAVRPPGRRRLGGRLSREHWLALCAGAIAFVLIFAALRDRRETVMVVVAREPIPAATRVTTGMVSEVEVPADSSVLSSLVELDALLADEQFTTRPVAEGEPLTVQALAGDLPGDGLRSMSLPVPREHAAGGDLRAGDRADVLGVVEGSEVDYVATGIEVLGVGEARSGAVGARPTEFSVTVAVDQTQARLLARALAAGNVEVVRSTGATPVTSGPSTGQGGG